MRFDFSSASGARAVTSLPMLPLSLCHRGGPRLAVEGLLDTGASVNVLPHRLGLQLGASWSERAPVVRLTGNLSRFEARALLVLGQVADFPPVPSAFAWSQAEEVPLLLGQVNFFADFDVCFYRSQFAFDIRPRSGTNSP